MHEQSPRNIMARIATTRFQVSESTGAGHSSHNSNGISNAFGSGTY